MINDLCYHVSDLHGSKHRYESLFHRILSEQPAAVFMGGDILPSGSLPAIKMGVQCSDFIGEYLRPQLNQIKKTLGPKTPKIFVILGNDDPRSLEPAIKSLSDDGLCEYIHNKKVFFRGFTIYGYSFVPPTPFMFKDWNDTTCPDMLTRDVLHPMRDTALSPRIRTFPNLQRLRMTYSILHQTPASTAPYCCFIRHRTIRILTELILTAK